MPREEKKVEYLELIYDLIFVYIIGKNNDLLYGAGIGFITVPAFLTYVVCTLAIIQIWNFSTYYINMYGRNSIRNHIALFLNMYLLYYIGEGTRMYWQRYLLQYHVAWALILVNIGVQYLFELREHGNDPKERKTILHMMTVLFVEAGLVLCCIPLYTLTGAPLSVVPILAGIVLTWYFSDESKAERVDFPHLTERAMLYVVFTFGEMIIAIAAYFEGIFTLNSVYFSTMSFLIVVGLFLCYGMLYDHVIDRELQSTGLKYMLVHIFLIFSMNNITTSLNFMRNEAVTLLPKVLFLAGSFLLYFLCLGFLLRFAKSSLELRGKRIVPAACVSVLFFLLMILLREKMVYNILISVLYVSAMAAWIFRLGKQGRTKING